MNFEVFGLEFRFDVNSITSGFYCDNLPDSIFNKDVMIAIKAEDIRKTLSVREYEVFRGNRRPS